MIFPSFILSWMMLLWVWGWFADSLLFSSISSKSEIVPFHGDKWYLNSYRLIDQRILIIRLPLLLHLPQAINNLFSLLLPSRLFSVLFILALSLYFFSFSLHPIFMLESLTPKFFPIYHLLLHHLPLYELILSALKFYYFSLQRTNVHTHCKEEKNDEKKKKSISRILITLFCCSFNLAKKTKKK